MVKMAKRRPPHVAGRNFPFSVYSAGWIAVKLATALRQGRLHQHFIAHTPWYH